mmetsp:Transcript_13568/g.38164  ORF Transcript_13568/g.38164 Transcript_13568/m.38164 type:complete len:1360 (-) Transcript_13568:377-4456(-)
MVRRKKKSPKINNGDISKRSITEYIENDHKSQQKLELSSEMTRQTASIDADIFMGGDENLERNQQIDAEGMRASSQSLDLWAEDYYNSSEFEKSKSIITPTNNDDSGSGSGSESASDRKRYPFDCYSFLSLHGPMDNIYFFGFGMVVFFFQMSFLVLIVLSVLDQKWSNNGDVDNPGDGIIASFVAANTSPLVRATQVISVLSYVLFADSSLLDVTTGVETFPWRTKKATKSMFFSCALRFSQGALASATALLTIVASETVIDIVLNFTALNFISHIDDVAFELAMDGRYGPKLEAEAKRIAELELPRCVSKGNNLRRFKRTLVAAALCLLGMLAAIIYGQESKNVWLTKVLRVEFQDESLRAYSGCYSIDETASLRRGGYKRMMYTSDKKSSDKAQHFGYCVDDHRWTLFEGATDACSAGEGKLAHSAMTPSFDVSTAFDDGWYSVSGTPLDLYFIQLGKDVEDRCSSLDNGECDPFFNTYQYQYDGGDCCAATCSHPRCGIGAMAEVFGTVGTNSKGFPLCKNPKMIPVTIHLDNFTSSRSPANMRQKFNKREVETLSIVKSQRWWDKKPTSPTLTLRCDEKNVLVVNIDERMRNQTETVFVNDGASCRMTVTNRTRSEEAIYDPPIWYFDITMFLGSNGDSSNMRILETNTGEQGSASFEILSIPTCMIEKLSGYTNMTTIYIDNRHSFEAVRWMIEESAGNAECYSDFLTEIFALSVLNFGAPVSGGKDSSWIEANTLCQWAAIECNNDDTLSSLKLSSSSLSGTVSTSIGLLTSLTTILLDGNSLTGKIPSEIGLLSSLETLRLGENTLSDQIPTEIGLLSSLQETILGYNLFTGTIPSEIGKLTASKVFKLNYAPHVVGTIPTEICMLKSLEELRLDSNDLRGHLLTEIGTLTRLQELKLNENNLTGEVPSELGLLSSLKFLNLARNQLKGRIPTEIGMLHSILQDLNLEKNSMTGDIPTEIGLLSLLELLHIGENLLTGTIPTEIGKLTNSKLLALSQTQVTGKIPTEIGMMKSLQELLLGRNNLKGKLPTEMGLLTRLLELRLNKNDVTGEIPSELGMLLSVHILDLAKNALTGTIPTTFGMLNSSVEVLDLASNSLTGKIPTEVGLFSSIEKLFLNSNALTGVIPIEIGELRSLCSLALGSNLLSGAIPTVIGEMISLIWISLDNNKLTGTIPSEIGLLTTINHLSLYNNTLSGSLPSEIGKLTLLTHLSVDKNTGINGLIPSELGMLTDLKCLELDTNNFDSPIPTSVKDILERGGNCQHGKDDKDGKGGPNEDNGPPDADNGPPKSDNGPPNSDNGLPKSDNGPPNSDNGIVGNGGGTSKVTSKTEGGEKSNNNNDQAPRKSDSDMLV